ncbi:MAG: hypothetical protein C0505_07700 [Leptothrix sp. (in: Bacteria)]|nr:hypothetical protein [Leptothrix sp. (in: b-proteobacteria)]
MLTGAGLSADSGIAAFRDALSGHCARFNPAETASEDGFRAHPQRVWDCCAGRRAGVGAALPNLDHLAIAACARRHRCAATARRHIHAQRGLDVCPRHAERGVACSAESARPGRPRRAAR